eukprot:TRINITY_DN14511_c0_g2_i1.p1 TRINITY_DN14511_c0_g2~~TRINITY_DN14511_c0_g2_i1.p1  ORF type:complete len:100 (+),score=11.69 TRINITY_DN14511_c0_g2_i1:190-489(+)
MELMSMYDHYDDGRPSCFDLTMHPINHNGQHCSDLVTTTSTTSASTTTSTTTVTTTTSHSFAETCGSDGADISWCAANTKGYMCPSSTNTTGRSIRGQQ